MNVDPCYVHVCLCHYSKYKVWRGGRWRLDMGPKAKQIAFAYEDSLEYRQKRDRNNVSVKKSREKSKIKQRETIEKVNRLRVENQQLEMKVTLLSKELDVLRELFKEHAGPNVQNFCNQNVAAKTEAGPPVNTIAVEADHEYSSKTFHKS